MVAAGAPSEALPTYSVLLVGSLRPHEGRSALAAALAVALAYEGRRMLLLRLAGADADAAAAEADAAFFRTLPFARGRGGRPVTSAEALSAAAEQRQAGGLLVLEAPADADLAALAADLDAAVLLAVRAGGPDVKVALSQAAAQLGARLAGAVVLAVPQAQSARAAEPVSGVALLGVVPEDATLYAPSVLELAEALDAEVVLGEPTDADVVEHVMIGSITTDPGQPYYARPHNRRAVITRGDKTDLQLAAMHTDIDCLILTGGVAPSPYTIDRAVDNEITVLLTRSDTRGAVGLVEDIWLSTRFASDHKLERMRALMSDHFDWDALKRRLA